MIKTRLLTYKCELELSGLDFESLSEKDGKLWRLLFEGDDERNYKPAYILNFNRFKEDLATGKLNPAGFGLSVYNSKESLIEKYNRITKNKKRVITQIGSCAGYGNVSVSDGCVSEVNNEGHITFYDYMTCDVSRLFTIEEKI